MGIGITFFLYLQAFNLFMHRLKANLRGQNKKQAYATFQAILEMTASFCKKIRSFISYFAQLSWVSHTFFQTHEAVQVIDDTIHVAKRSQKLSKH